MLATGGRDHLYARIGELNAIIEAKDAEIAQLKEMLGGGLLAFPELHLSAKQSAVLAALYAARGPVRRSYLFELVWGLNSDVDPKIVDVIIFHVRKRLARHDIAIRTIWGQGYSLDERDRVALATFAKGGSHV